MGSELRDSAKRVQEFLLTRGFSFKIKELPESTRTVQEAAGTPFAVFTLKPSDLEALTKGRWVDLSEELTSIA